MNTAWHDFFDGVTPTSPLYREQAALYVASLSAAIGLQKNQRVLDFGCGFGFVAALVAPSVTDMWWWEPSPNMRSVAERTLADVPNARYCDLSALPFAVPEGASWQGPSFDVIVVNSVAQYLAPEELWAWLPWWRRMLEPSGRLVISDLIPREHGSVADVLDVLRLGVSYGSLRAAGGALGGVAHYWRVRHAVPLTRVDRDELTNRAAEAGLDTVFLPNNLTHFRKRLTAVLRPRRQL